MEMHQVRYFLAVCRTLNFTKAAEECNVAQPSLTRAVQKLEDELGGPLFHRERANTHLTELGRLMQPHLEQTYSAAQAAKTLATSIRKGSVAPLRLAIDTTVPMKPVVDILSNLRQSIDGIELTLGSGTRRAVLADALEGDFDLVVASQAGETPDRMRSWLLFREQCNVIVPEGHRFAQQASVTLADLDGEPMIERVDCCLSPGFNEACQAAGVRTEFRHRATSEDQLQRMVLAGFGAGVSPPTIPLLPGLVAVPIEGKALEREVVLATVAGRRFSVAADAFVKVARARDWSKAPEAA
ncbi:MAG TPA: LysR family transcriptional regulator [Rhizomicrobium sp.]|jgi:DNA-binding transcriptional LysR family regulator|nr:LysR family transcriptional regulator [Rhizomicrobium sp.]